MKTCFVISPVGQDGSDIRKNADDLFDLIIQPALEIFDFKVIRADKLQTVSAINDDIINYVQNAELCIVDLTGHNPNVFYECGRRHETARPYIHIKRKGEQIPFDISGIRTIDYDLSDGRKIRESIDSLRKFITELENTGYSSQSSTFSLNTLATTLTRIERKLDNLSTNGAPSAATAKESKTEAGSPYRVYWDALDSGDYQKATNALKRFMNINYDSSLHLDLCCNLTDAFEPSAVVVARQILDTKFDTLKMSIVAIALDSLTRFYGDAMAIDEQYDALKAYIEKALQSSQNDVDKGSIYNVYANLEYTKKNYLKALEYQKKAVEFYPNSSVLHYNLARIYDILGKNKEVLETIDNYVYVVSNQGEAIKNEDIRYLNYAKNKYEEARMMDQAAKVDALIAAKQGVK